MKGVLSRKQFTDDSKCPLSPPAEKGLALPGGLAWYLHQVLSLQLLNLKPYTGQCSGLEKTLNPKHSTLNIKHSTLNPKP